MTTERPEISPRVLAILDEAAGQRLRVRYLDDDQVYAELLLIRRIAWTWRSSGADATPVGVSATRTASSEVTAEQAAQLLGITPNGVRTAIRRGQLDGTKRAGRWFVALDDIARHATRQ